MPSFRSAARMAAGQVSSSCKLCSPGQYAEESGAMSCQLCRKGSYSDKEGSELCTACGDGKTMTTRTQGADSAALCGCAEGLFYGDQAADGTCTKCGESGAFEHLECNGLFECSPLEGMQLSGSFPCEKYCVAGAELCAEECIVPVLMARRLCEDPALGFSLQCDGWTLVDVDLAAVHSGTEMAKSTDLVYDLTEQELEDFPEEFAPPMEYLQSATARLGSYGSKDSPLVEKANARTVLQALRCTTSEEARLQQLGYEGVRLEAVHAEPLVMRGYVTRAVADQGGKKLLTRQCANELACPGGLPYTCSPGPIKGRSQRLGAPSSRSFKVALRCCSLGRELPGSCRARLGQCRPCIATHELGRFSG